MRGLRELASDVWYEVRTSVNNSEPLFRSQPNQDLLKQVLYEARQIYGFELRGLRFSGPEVSFYIGPAVGFQLPDIMQWIKQTFAVRFNVIDGRTGHIWGDRYWSLILLGEPPVWAEAYVFVPVVCGTGRRRRKAAEDEGGGVVLNATVAVSPSGVGVCPKPGKIAAKPYLPSASSHHCVLRSVIRR
jgi:hypothetical protein